MNTHVKVIFLHNTLSNTAKDKQQLYGLLDEIERILNASPEISFSADIEQNAYTNGKPVADGKAEDVIAQDMSNIDLGIQQLQQFIAANAHSRHIIVASGSDGLFNFLRICEKAFIPRDICKLIWIGTAPESFLSNSILDIDLAILPYWQIPNLDQRKIKTKLMSNEAGIFHDWQRRHPDYDPPTDFLAGDINPEQTRFIGFVIGSHESFSDTLFKFWLDKIIASSSVDKKPYFLIFNSPEMGRDLTYLEVVKAYLTELQIPYAVFDYEETLNERSITQIALNFIDEHSGEIFVTGDLLALAYNIIQSSRAFLHPEVYLLTPDKLDSTPLIEPSFVREKYLDYNEITRLKERPWLTLGTPSSFNADLTSNSISGLISQLTTIQGTKKKMSGMAKLCDYISAPFYSMFHKRGNQTYKAVNQNYPDTTFNPLQPRDADPNSEIIRF